jgi:hypothetical protein
MRLEIVIDIDNPVYDKPPQVVIGRILKRLGVDLEKRQAPPKKGEYKLRDAENINGLVGHWTVTDGL